MVEGWNIGKPGLGILHYSVMPLFHYSFYELIGSRFRVQGSEVTIDGNCLSYESEYGIKIYPIR
jgi:hypothetical protein